MCGWGLVAAVGAADELPPTARPTPVTGSSLGRLVHPPLAATDNVLRRRCPDDCMRTACTLTLSPVLPAYTPHSLFLYLYTCHSLPTHLLPYSSASHTTSCPDTHRLHPSQPIPSHVAFFSTLFSLFLILSIHVIVPTPHLRWPYSHTQPSIRINPSHFSRPH